jgi:hypothetical protein
MLNKSAHKTKAQIKRSHDDMARFIRALCQRSDEIHYCRADDAEERYQRALVLLRRAGFPYERKVPDVPVHASAKSGESK